MHDHREQPSLAAGAATAPGALTPSGVPPALSTRAPTAAVAAPAAALGRAGTVFQRPVSMSTAIPEFGFG